MLKKYLHIFSLSLLFIVSTNVNGQTDELIELVDIEFIGNDSFNDSKLEDIIISKESSNWFSQFLYSFSDLGSPPSYFDSLIIQDDVNLLLSLYKANGFFKAEVSAEYEVIQNENKTALLKYLIDEGPRSTIRKLKLNGLENLPLYLKENINDFVSIDSSTYYSENLLEEKNLNIVNFLQDRGYMLIEAEIPIVEIDTLRNTVDVTTKFNLGKRYRISSINVEKTGQGKDLVDTKLIKDIANLTTGEYYSYNELKLAQIRLYRTNLFSSAIISGEVNDTVGNNVPIGISARVGLLNELAPELILINENNALKFGLGLSYTNRNFLGDARKLTVSTSAAAQDFTEFLQNPSLTSNNIYGFIDTRLGIEQPFLFGEPINTQFETYYTLEKRKNQWNANIYGAKLNLNFDLPQYTFITAFSTYLNWQHSKYKFQEDYLTSRLPDSIDYKDLITTTTNSTNAILGIEAIANKTDDLIFPTKGFTVSLIAEDGNSIPYLASLAGGYNFNNAAYYKIVLTSTAYLPYAKNIFESLGLKFKIGVIGAYHGNKSEIPYNQRFVAGGSNSLRGWGSNDLPVSKIINLPENPTKNDIENIARNITPGGFSLLEGSIEGRLHISKLIGFAAFIDYGNVWDNFNKIKLEEFAVSTGLGFRYYSDFAPIRLDFGFKAYNPNDRRSFFNRLEHSPFLDNLKFQIGIGEAF